MSADTSAIIGSRLRIAKITRDVLSLMLNLLGIESPEVMLKA
jgi:arginyl-tRNA synthetase